MVLGVMEVDVLNPDRAVHTRPPVLFPSFCFLCNGFVCAMDCLHDGFVYAMEFTWVCLHDGFHMSFLLACSLCFFALHRVSLEDPLACLYKGPFLPCSFS